MHSQSVAPSEREQRLDEVVTAYLQALGAGQTPDRQELLARHPDLASELAAFFADQDRVHQLAAPLRPIALAARVATPPPADTPLPGVNKRAKSRDSGTEIIGRSFGDYELLQEIGRGGMGLVYMARQKSLNRLVALKMIRHDDLESEANRRRFHDEAETVAALDHPHIVPIHEVGEMRTDEHSPPVPYFSMKLMPGGSLAHAMELGQWVVTDKESQQRAARLLVVIAGAVHHAHQRGILHRDLKPANILLDAEGQPHVTDFGLAKRLDMQRSSTQSGLLVGTPSYMAPEQAAGKKDAITTATDVHGLGVILYILLTGQLPFKGEDVLDTLNQIRHYEPEPPRRINWQINADLDTICLKCLEKDPRRRYDSAKALADDLERWLAGEPITARPIGRGERVWRWCGRNPGVAVLSAALVLVAFGGIAGVISQWRRAERNLDDVKESQRLAEEARERADTQRQLAEENEQKAETQRRRAEDGAEKLRSLFYPKDMSLTHRAWHDRDIPRMLNLLRPYQLQPELQGQRSFAWYYLWGLCHSELLTLQGHAKDVQCVAYSPDGSMLATASKDGTVKLWQASTGKELDTFRGHWNEVNQVAFSPDGKTLATASNDCSIKLWEIATRKVRTLFLAHWGSVEGVAFSPDGKTLASGGKDKIVKLWDPMTGKFLRSCAGHDGNIEAVAFAPDGQTLATASVDRTVKLWDPDTLKERITLRAHTGAVRTVTFSHHGRTIATGSDDRSVILWNAINGEKKVILQRHTDSVYSVVFSPDDHFLVSAGTDATLRIWDVNTGEQRDNLKGHIGRVWCVAFSPDGTKLATAGGDQTVKLWDLKVISRSMRLNRQQFPLLSVAFSPDSKLLAMGDSTGESSVRIWDVTMGQVWAKLKVHEGGSTVVAFAPDGKTLAVGCGNGDVKLWNLATQQERITLKNGHTQGPLASLAFSPDGRTLVSVGRDRTLRLWDVAAGQQGVPLPLYQQVPDPGDPGGVSCAAFSPDGQTLATATHDGIIKLWEVATRKERNITFGQHRGGIFCLAFAPDGRTLATGGNDKTVKLWDTNTGQMRPPLEGHGDRVASLAFCADGKTLATGSFDATVKLWDLVTGQELVTLRAHSTKVHSVTFSPDGKVLATGGESAQPGHTEVNLWFAATDKEVSARAK
jgi:WD40 repeat protein/tRNA A-37 threonylcarbamoyl transferase component Bud32